VENDKICNIENLHTFPTSPKISQVSYMQQLEIVCTRGFHGWREKRTQNYLGNRERKNILGDSDL